MVIVQLGIEWFSNNCVQLETIPQGLLGRNYSKGLVNLNTLHMRGEAKFISQELRSKHISRGLVKLKLSHKTSENYPSEKTKQNLLHS